MGPCTFSRVSLEKIMFTFLIVVKIKIKIEMMLFDLFLVPVNDFFFLLRGNQPCSKSCALHPTVIKALTG